MKKICFVLTVSSLINYVPIFAGPTLMDTDVFKDYFSGHYDVSTNYIRDKDSVDYLVVPDPFPPFDNENHLPIIKVPALLFMQRDFEQIKTYIDDYFSLIV
ncbi:hypothetical protein JZO81_01880 [Enterococcus hulanensis]|uniref:hypothetical protein n=1 Tax=Enterococcus hulanensis TaxID=2559929 RepID=UPI001A92F786|nr:hypothetical protein [Enterococcus hulanensis]MBO0409784.1 hypothetical protein [Enterococcus hulanensis]